MDKKHSLNLALTGTAVLVGSLTGMPILSSLMVGVGTNWAANLGWQGWEAIRDRTLTTDDNLSRAFGRAFSNAAAAFTTTGAFLRLSPDEQKLCREGLTHLQQEVDSLFADLGAIPDHLLAQQQATGDPAQTVDTMRRALNDYFYGYPDPFIRYMREQFDPQRLAGQFGRELLRDEPARTAFQLLLLQTVEQQTAVLLAGQQALSADVQEVRGWLARWQVTPPEQQRAQFEAALTAALDKIAHEIKAHTTAERGYEVVGIDLNDTALDVARCQTRGRASYLSHDMRRLAELPGSFDAVLSLWQSFGYFDEETNRDVLCQMCEKLRPNGRLILDIYHRAYFEKRQGMRRLERKGVPITITETINGNRLTAVLHYGDGSGETFSWQLFTPAEICQLAAEFGLRCRLACTEADEQKPVTPDKPRVQYVFELAS